MYFWCPETSLQILICPPEIGMDLQVCLPPALTTIHNFICDLDLTDLSNFTEVEDIQPSWHLGDLADALPHHAEKERVNNRHDNIANAMCYDPTS